MDPRNRVDPLVERTQSLTERPDMRRPNAARMYDYYLGGSSNFAVDRAAAEAALTVFPDSRRYARANRAFLGRAVRYLLRQGIDQFLDLGSGIPTVGNVHEIALQEKPAARVAYVDHEPVIVEHSRMLLGDNPKVTVTQADICVPETVLGAPGVAGHLDFGRPVAVLAVAVLPFIPDDDDALRAVHAYRRACVAGSYLAVSHISPARATPEQARRATEVMANTPTPVKWRTRSQIGRLLTGYTLVEPGLVLSPNWRPDTAVTSDEAAAANAYAAVGYLPAGW